MAKKERSRAYANIGAWLKSRPDKVALRAALQELRKLFGNPDYDDLAWYHDVGRLVARLCPKNHCYGAGVIRLIGTEIDPDRKPKDFAIFLYRARDFATRYEGRGAAKELAARKNANGGRLTRMHIAALLLSKDDKQRDGFLKKCLAESWSAKELMRQVQNATGKRSRGGRPPVPPKYTSVPVALRDIRVMARRWTAYHGAWFGGKLPFRDPAAKDQDEDLLQEIEAATAGLEGVRRDVSEALTHLKTLAGGLKSRLSADKEKRTARRKRSS